MSRILVGEIGTYWAGKPAAAAAARRDDVLWPAARGGGGGLDGAKAVGVALAAGVGEAAGVVEVSGRGLLVAEAEGEGEGAAGAAAAGAAPIPAITIDNAAITIRTSATSNTPLLGSTTPGPSDSPRRPGWAPSAPAPSQSVCPN